MSSRVVSLSEYAALIEVTYLTAWDHYRKGKIPNAFKDERGRIYVPVDDVPPVEKVAEDVIKVVERLSERVAQINVKMAIISAKQDTLLGMLKHIEDGVGEDK